MRLYNLFVQPIHDSSRHWAEPAFAMSSSFLSSSEAGTGTSSSSTSTPLLDAMNLWIGNECSILNVHKDYYENLFYGHSGIKIFPPCDVLYLYEHYKQYHASSFVLSIINDQKTILNKRKKEEEEEEGQCDDNGDGDDYVDDGMKTHGGTKSVSSAKSAASTTAAMED